MTPKTIKNPRWGTAEKNVIICDVEFVELPHEGVLEFAANPLDVADHGREIYARALKGEFGAIKDYIVP